MGSVNKVILVGNLGADPELVAYMNARIEVRGECWEWTGEDDHGYGRVNFRKQNDLASRVAWELVNGPSPRGLFLLHRCDNPPCVRPDHLFLGTKGDNNRDSMVKGRKAQKLTPQRVREIRALYGGDLGYGRLAQNFGVSRAMIRNIVKGRSWGWV